MKVIIDVDEVKELVAEGLNFRGIKFDRETLEVLTMSEYDQYDEVTIREFSGFQFKLRE
jgi:hypothetical protein